MKPIYPARPARLTHVPSGYVLDVHIIGEETHPVYNDTGYIVQFGNGSRVTVYAHLSNFKLEEEDE